jgi:predicted ATPase
MIQRLRLKGFKAFELIELQHLAQITLIGGENSVGKSSILEAIFLFFDRRNPEMILRQFGWRGLNRVFLAADQLFSPIFHDYLLTQDIVISLLVDGVEERLKLRFSEKQALRRISFEKVKNKGLAQTRTDEKPVVKAKLDLEYTKGQFTDTSTLVVAAKGLVLRDENERIDDRPAIYVSPRTPSTPAEDAQRFGELDIRGEVDGAVEFLKKFDPRINGLTSVFYGDSSVIHADIGLPRKVPLPHLGEGLSFLLSAYLAVSAVKHGILLVDEVGTGIHYHLLPTFWSAIASAVKKFECQLIATTHSYECLEAANTGLKGLFEPNFTYIRLDRQKSGKIKPTSFTFPVFQTALESGWEVR